VSAFHILQGSWETSDQLELPLGAEKACGGNVTPPPAQVPPGATLVLRMPTVNSPQTPEKRKWPPDDS